MLTCDLDLNDSSPIFLHDTDSWWCTTIPSLVTNSAAVQKIPSGQSPNTRTDRWTQWFHYTPQTLLWGHNQEKLSCVTALFYWLQAVVEKSIVFSWILTVTHMERRGTFCAKTLHIFKFHINYTSNTWCLCTPNSLLLILSMLHSFSFKVFQWRNKWVHVWATYIQR